MEIKELHLIFKGKVQGVGFRWTVVEMAQRYQLTGWVKNVPNGDVEAVAQGERDNLELFLESFKEMEVPIQIDSIFSKYRIPKEVYNHFKILR